MKLLGITTKRGGGGKKWDGKAPRKSNIMPRREQKRPRKFSRQRLQGRTYCLY